MPGIRFCKFVFLRGSRGGWTIAALGRLFHRPQSFFLGQQWSGLHALAGSSRCKCHADSGSAYEVRHFRNRYNIILPEREPSAYYFSA
jgi:hypothetical protein